jgi:iron complex outermembrane receptor protein
VNASYEKANSFRDNVRVERFYANPSFLLKVSARTEVLVEADYITDRRTSDYGTGAINYTIAAIPRNTFLGAPWSYNQSEQKTATITTTHRLSANWELKNITNYSNYTNDLCGACSVPAPMKNT